MMSRRGFLASVSALALGGAMFSAGMAGAVTPRFLESEPFGRDTVLEMARAMAAQPFVQRDPVPEAWLNLTYDQYRKIWFDPRNAVWSDQDLPFEMDLFHPGLYFPRAVEVDVVRGDQAHRLAFDFSLFEKADDVPELPVDETMGGRGVPGVHPLLDRGAVRGRSRHRCPCPDGQPLGHRGLPDADHAGHRLRDAGGMHDLPARRP